LAEWTTFTIADVSGNGSGRIARDESTVEGQGKVASGKSLDQMPIKGNEEEKE
jgi:hypothetical protein